MKIKILVFITLFAFVICACNTNVIRENPNNARYNEIFTTIELNNGVNFQRKKVALIIGVDPKIGTVPAQDAHIRIIENAAQSVAHSVDAAVHSYRASRTNNRNERARRTGEAMASAVAGIGSAMMAAEMRHQLNEYAEVLKTFSNLYTNPEVKNKFSKLIKSRIRQSLNEHRSINFASNNYNIDNFNVSSQQYILNGIFANYHKLKQKNIDYVMQIMLKITYIHTPHIEARIMYQLAGVLVDLKKIKPPTNNNSETNNDNNSEASDNSSDGKLTPVNGQENNQENEQDTSIASTSVIWRSLAEADVYLKKKTKTGFRVKYYNYKNMLNGNNPLIHRVTQVTTSKLLKMLCSNFKRQNRIRKIKYTLDNFR